MTTYTYSQLESIWTEGGGSSALAPVMAAIALAESSGNPNAIGPSFGGDSGSWGLWQIQPSAHPGMQQTSDPVQQAADANQVLQSQGLSAWSTYTNGSYKQYYSPGTAPSGPVGQAQQSLLASGGPAQGPSCCMWNVGGLCMDGVIGWGVAALGALMMVLGFVAAGRAI